MLHEVIEQAPLTYGRNRTSLDAETLVKSHGQLVRRIAWHVHSRMSTAIEIADLIQIGSMALIEAARNFEDRGLAFAPYATARIRGSMIDQLRREARMCRSGMANRRKMASVRAALENSLHRRATDTEMAHALDLSLDGFHVVVQSARSLQQDSLDEVYSDHDFSFADYQERADDQIEREQINKILAQNIATLSEREALILQLYFVEELNLDEIGEILNVGAARICQIKKSSLEKLRGKMEDTYFA
jgi:RNA polymerase sigma factor FliA